MSRTGPPEAGAVSQSRPPEAGAVSRPGLPEAGVGLTFKVPQLRNTIIAVLGQLASQSAASAS